MEGVEVRQTRVEQAMEQERERIRRERAEEMRERDIRRKNVVMHRVGEAGENVRSIEERKNWDLRSCDNIFRVLNLDMSSENAVKFCRRVGEKGDGPRPLIVGLKREWQKEDLLEAAKNLRNTQFSETVIIPDLTQEQRREEAEMNNEVERRNRDLTQEDRAKNVEWMVVGARGERRMVKGAVRARMARGAARGGGTGRPVMEAAATANGGLAPVLLPARPAPEPWDPMVGGRGRGAAAGGSQRARGGRRPSNKRTRAEMRERIENENDQDTEEEEMEEGRPGPPPPPHQDRN
jgi:hypothetical protein